MKITASKITADKREDILKRKAEYEAKRAEYEADRAERVHKFGMAEYDVMNPIKERLESDLSIFNLLQFVVRVERHYGGKGVRVRIECNENRKFDDSVALAWNYDVNLTKDGEVKRESSSWSGMSAVTPEQVASLKQTVEAVEYLLNLDWASLLDVTLPEFSDYYTGALPEPEREDFDTELREAELEGYVGTDTLILVENFESSGWRGREVYVRLIRETPSQYVCNIFHPYELSSFKEQGRKLADRYTQRVKKSNIVPVVKDGHLVTTTI